MVNYGRRYKNGPSQLISKARGLMSAAIVFTVIGLVLTFASVAIAYVIYRENHGDRGEKKSQDAAVSAAEKVVAPLLSRLAVLETVTGPATRDREQLITKGIVSEALKPLGETVARLDTKLDLMDSTFKSLAAEMVKILHHPDPDRKRVDDLLENYMDGTLTSEERLELRRNLTTIRNWEVGRPAPYTIHPGEQVAAAILLKLLEQEDIEKSRV
jgi:hypothetical protein